MNGSKRREEKQKLINGKLITQLIRDPTLTVLHQNVKITFKSERHEGTIAKKVRNGFQVLMIKTKNTANIIHRRAAR